MPRVGYRRLLPMINAIIYRILIYSGLSIRQHEVLQRKFRSFSPGSVVLVDACWQQEGAGVWEPITDGHWLPGLHHAAFAIDLLAILVAAVMGLGSSLVLGVNKLPCGSSWDENLVIATCIFFFVAVPWFLVGRWFDRRVGMLPPPRLRASRGANILRIAGAVTATAAYLGLLAYGIVEDGFRRDAPPLLLIWLMWVVFITFVSASNLRRARNKTLVPPIA